MNSIIMPYPILHCKKLLVMVTTLGSEHHYFVLHYHVVKLIGSDSHY